MKTTTIKFTTQCPSCGDTDHHVISGMGQSHAEWLGRLAQTGIYPGWHCKGCKQIVDAKLYGVESEEGK